MLIFNESVSVYKGPTGGQVIFLAHLVFMLYYSAQVVLLRCTLTMCISEQSVHHYILYIYLFQHSHFQCTLWCTVHHMEGTKYVFNPLLIYFYLIHIGIPTGTKFTLEVSNNARKPHIQEINTKYFKILV